MLYKLNHHWFTFWTQLFVVFQEDSGRCGWHVTSEGGQERHGCFSFVVLGRSRKEAVVGGCSDSATKRAMWQGTEASGNCQCYLTAAQGSQLESGLSSPPSDLLPWQPGWHFDCAQPHGRWNQSHSWSHDPQKMKNSKRSHTIASSFQSCSLHRRPIEEPCLRYRRSMSGTFILTFSGRRWLYVSASRSPQESEFTGELISCSNSHKATLGVIGPWASEGCTVFPLRESQGQWDAGEWAVRESHSFLSAKDQNY